MKTVVLLHGSYGSPYENWIPSVSEHIRGRGHLPLAITLPTPFGQTFENWSRILDGYRGGGLLGDASVVVAHSSSCSFAVKYLASRQVGVRGIVTVSGFTGFISGNEDFDAINAAVDTTSPEDYTDLRALSRNRVAFISDNDPNLPNDILRDFASRMHAEEVVIPGAGHFNSASGYGTFEALQERVIGILES